MERMLNTYIGVAHSGVERIIDAAFAMSDLVNRHHATWIGFHLDMAVGHLTPKARQAAEDRITTFLNLVPAAFHDSELRHDITREDAADLLWIALSGAQLQSDVLRDNGSLRLDRLTRAWKAALRAIVRTELFPFVEQYVIDTTARYKLSEDETIAPALAV